MLPKTLFLSDVHAAYAQGVSPMAVLENVYSRIVRLGDPGIFLDLFPLEDLLAEAASLGEFDPAAMPLWGIPFAVKDNIDVAGRRTTAGCEPFAYTPATDAFVVWRLRDAGAIAIGKTNLDQFATGLVGLRTFAPAPLNAVDPALAPGGSSSGSGVAVAHGLVTFALGTDTAGSGRVPAALNNIVGLKPTLGRLSATGVVPACRTLDTISIFALSCEDATAVLDVASGFDVDDAYSRRDACDDRTVLGPNPVFGIPDERSLTFLGDDIQAASFANAIELLGELGATVKPIDFAPFFEVAELLYQGAWVAERYTVIDELLRTNRDSIHPITREVVTKAENFSAADTFRGMYRLAELKRVTEPLLDAVDALLVPTVPTLFRVDQVLADPVGTNSQLGLYTNFVNLLDLCGIAVPIGGRKDNLPGSVTLLGAAASDRDLAAFAGKMHRAANVSAGATGWALTDHPIDIPPAPVRSQEIEIAVVGAHMTGLPLNREVTRLGGRFLRATTTAPCYQLYRLLGGPPERPGLVRTREGAAIALEVWALPRSSIGAFLAGIPQPLGLGTITLNDGKSVHGFLCEQAGLDGATDITEFGGWRAYQETQRAAE